jgi:hypothetical protein
MWYKEMEDDCLRVRKVEKGQDSAMNCCTSSEDDINKKKHLVEFQVSFLMYNHPDTTYIYTCKLQIESVIHNSTP